MHSIISRSGDGKQKVLNVALTYDNLCHKMKLIITFDKHQPYQAEFANCSCFRH